jgi:hypothetical protein
VSDPAGEEHDLFDAISRLTKIAADIAVSRPGAETERLRAVLASTLRERLGNDAEARSVAADLTRLSPLLRGSEDAEALEDLIAAGGGLADAALEISRRDERELLRAGTLVDQLTGLLPSERLGPFPIFGGIDVWFDVFLAARRMEVRETGVIVPALVLTQARPAITRRGRTVVDLEPGTVWIRGDLLDAGLPAGSFAGIRVEGGSLRLNQPATTSDAVVEVAAPLAGVLLVQPAADEVNPVSGGCDSAGTVVTLPETLTFAFDGGATVEGATGKAEAWGQSFTFERPTGDWTFIEPLWTAVLGYTVDPTKLAAEPIADDLARFAGTGSVTAAGLGLPVVVAANPAILGEAAIAGSWFLRVDGLTARWYDPDPRAHLLDNAWVGIAASGATIVADGVQPLSPVVTHAYDLWSLPGGNDRRLPWRQTYEAPFSIFYRCNVIEGEYLLAAGRATVALDRPVTTDGVPVPTPTGDGALLLHRFNGATTVALGAAVEDPQAVHQFALRNALVWTAAPSFVYARGELLGVRRIDAGSVQMFFGVLGWAPTLPDPYVSNGFIRRPRVGRPLPDAQLVCRVFWSAPERVSVAFEGRLGSGVALGSHDPSAGEPRPARRNDGDLDVGLTQVEQDRLTFDRDAAATWKAAQADEVETRGARRELANQENATTERIVDGYMEKTIGPAPNLFLLDVSTNQDLLGVGVALRSVREGIAGEFPVSELAVNAAVSDMRVVALPQVQWEPVRTLDADQDIMTMGWFPTPLASATDGGATHIGARSQRLMPVIPEDALTGTFDAFRDGTPVGIRTTFPFGLIGVVRLQPQDTAQRRGDLYGLTRPKFPAEQSTGGIQITAHAEGGRPDDGGISPTFVGFMRQLLNGVDLATGSPLGISVLGETLQPAGSVETVFNNDMAARPRVPVTRIDLSGYGGSNFSDWNNPFAAFAEAAKVQFRLMIGRTALEVIKVNSVLHPWGIRITRSITIERRPGGGVIRRDSGWQAFTPGLFDYRYLDLNVGDIVVAPYQFDAGVFRGLFNVRTIRPAPGAVFTHGTATLVPYYFDADVALEGVPGRTAAIGILGYLQTTPNGVPASADALQALIETQGPIGGPVEAWMNFGGSGLPFRVQRVEVDRAIEAGNPLFVATVRGAPRLPETGAWSVVVRPVANVPVNGGEATTVAENRGAPVIRRYPVEYFPGDRTVYTEPPLSGTPGDYRLADAVDLLTPATPANDYGLLQSTPTHAFLLPRPFVPAGGAPRIESGHRSALADPFARATSKGAFPPAGNTIELGPGSHRFDVTPDGKLALSSPVVISGHPVPLQIAGAPGHGSRMFYDGATLRLELDSDRWEAEFTGLRVWSDIVGLEQLTGTEMRIVGSTDQRPQIAEFKSLILQEIEEILRYIPLFGNRGDQGPIDLAATNSKRESTIEASVFATIPPPSVEFPAGSGVRLELSVTQKAGVDKASALFKTTTEFGVELEGKVPLLSVGVATVFLIVVGEVKFSLVSVAGSISEELLELMAFVGAGVEGKIGPFKAYAFLGIGFVLEYDAVANETKYGGLVALEAGVDLEIAEVKIRAELKGLVYDDGGETKCDYSGEVEIEVEIFLVISISASYEVEETTTL